MTELPDTYAYCRTFEPAIGAWGKRGDAVDFSVFLAAELGLKPKGVTTEKDGKFHRVYVPLISMYWHPDHAEDRFGKDAWDDMFVRMRREVKKWAVSE